MDRFALIIGSPGYAGYQNHLPGVSMDTISFIDFLKSPTGGGWYDNEIAFLENPTKEDVLNLVDEMNVYYTLTYFSGHGRHSQRERETILKLNDYEEIGIQELVNPSPKQLIITDACRTVMEPEHLGFISEGIEFPSRLSITRARRIFDSHLEKCESGIVVIYSCSIGEASLEDPQGGYYTRSLLNASQDWTKTINHYSILNVSGAFKLSVNYLKAHFITNQIPQLIGERRRMWYPFAIKQSKV